MKLKRIISVYEDDSTGFDPSAHYGAPLFVTFHCMAGAQQLGEARPLNVVNKSEIG
jgi:hypothetical protein